MTMTTAIGFVTGALIYVAWASILFGFLPKMNVFWRIFLTGTASFATVGVLAMAGMLH